MKCVRLMNLEVDTKSSFLGLVRMIANILEYLIIIALLILCLAMLRLMHVDV